MEVAGLQINVTDNAQKATANLTALTTAAKGAGAASKSMGGATAATAAQVQSLTGVANQNVAAMNNTAAASRRAATAMQGASFSTANLAAQFQDIGVTAAMGMNPLQIALQQGTQISAAFGGAGAAASVKMLGAAFLSVISPVSLAVIAFVALTAAGLQMIDWTTLGQGALHGIADGLELIAPYAAAAAAGLSLFYSPAILAGMVSVVAMLGRMATQAAITGAAMIAANPVGALVLGFAAVVAGLAIFRDEVEKVLGVDIIGIAQKGANYLIGSFVGAFEGIKAVWAKLPAAIGDAVVLGVNATIGAVEGMLNSIIGQINNFMNDVRMKAFEMGFPLKDGVGTAISPVTFDRVPSPSPGAAGEVSTAINQAISDAQKVDYVGGAIDYVSNAASGAADALRGLADGMGATGEASKKAANEAQRQADAYADITRGARQFIAEQNLEAQALGMTEEAAARLRYEQELLNKAANDNINLTGAQRQELGVLAGAMAAAEEATRRVTEIYQFGKGVFSDFFGDMKSGLRDGMSFWEALGNAGANALDKIADRALSMAANGIFDLLFGSLMGGITGGMGGGQWGVMGGFAGRPGMFGLPSFAGGGWTGDGSRSGGLDGMGGYLAMVHPKEQIIDTTRPSSQNQANDNGRRGDLHLHINGSGLNEQQLARAIADGIREYDSSLAPKVEAKFRTMQNDPRAADGSW